MSIVFQVDRLLPNVHVIFKGTDSSSARGQIHLCAHFALSTYSWRASEASETLSGVYKFELVRYVYIYIYICMEVRMSK